MSFIKVLTDVDGEVSSLPARVVNTNPDGSFNIQYLSKTEKKHTNGKTIYEYEVEIYNITEESIDEYMYDESECKFTCVNPGEFIKVSQNYDDDDDYCPSSDGDEEEEDEDSDEEDEEDEEDEDFYEEED
jgi:hypothetical protein